MKILYISEIDLSSQVSMTHAHTHIFGVVKALREMGHDVTLASPVTRSKNNTSDHIRIKIKKSKYFPTFFENLSFQFKIINLIKNQKNADLIYHRASSFSLLIGPYIRFLSQLKYVIEINGFFQQEIKRSGSNYFVRFITKIFEFITYHSAHIIFCVTSGIGEKLSAYFFVPSKKIIITSNGTDTNLFTPDKKSKVFFNDSRKVLGFVGVVAWWQGIKTLIDAVEILSAKKQKLGVIIVGSGSALKEIKAYVKIKNLEENFLFLGQQERRLIPSLINSFDVCVAPFTKERNDEIGLSPLKIFEYLSCAKPVLASRVLGVKEIIETNNIGYLFTPDDSFDLAKKITYLIDHMGEATERARRGREIVVSKYSWSSVAKKIIIASKRLLSTEQPE